MRVLCTRTQRDRHRDRHTSTHTQIATAAATCPSLVLPLSVPCPSHRHRDRHTSTHTQIATGAATCPSLVRPLSIPQRHTQRDRRRDRHTSTHTDTHKQRDTHTAIPTPTTKPKPLPEPPKEVVGVGLRYREGPNTWFGDGVGVSGGLKTEIWEQTAQIAPGPHGNTLLVQFPQSCCSCYLHLRDQGLPQTPSAYQDCFLGLPVSPIAQSLLVQFPQGCCSCYLRCRFSKPPSKTFNRIPKLQPATPEGPQG